MQIQFQSPIAMHLICTGCPDNSLQNAYSFPGNASQRFGIKSLYYRWRGITISANYSFLSYCESLIRNIIGEEGKLLLLSAVFFAFHLLPWSPTKVIKQNYTINYALVSL
ncbi:hypothetical protein GDO81_004200 [Engystomops pustulosus]|uniref:Uncharacterized protein n=1 Tax=Engystomops pustulosus TaxID=76066 RepID=A0AAV7A013_ENGPU|nr:hypothetical protein GDO81_004200 [Engystomops pustulosus]